MEPILIVSSVLLWGLVLLNLLLTLGLARRISAKLPQIDSLKVGALAPDFSAQTLNGETVGLADYAGRAVALIFISPHCQPCREQLPAIPALKAKAAEQGIELVLVSDGDEIETRSLVGELDGRLPLLVAPRARNTFIGDYKATVTPSYVLLDQHGKVEAAGIGLHDLKARMANAPDKEVT